MKDKGLISIKPDVIVTPIKSKAQEEKDFHESEKQLLKDIAKAYGIDTKDIKKVRR